MLEMIRKKLHRSRNHSCLSASLAATGVVVGSSLVYYLLKRNHVI